MDDGFEHGHCRPAWYSPSDNPSTRNGRLTSDWTLWALFGWLILGEARETVFQIEGLGFNMWCFSAMGRRGFEYLFDLMIEFAHDISNCIYFTELGTLAAIILFHISRHPQPSHNYVHSISWPTTEILPSIIDDYYFNFFFLFLNHGRISTFAICQKEESFLTYIWSISCFCGCNNTKRPLNSLTAECRIVHS